MEPKESNRYFDCITINEKNGPFIQQVKEYVNADDHHIAYVLDKPLGTKYNYDYYGNVLVILSPNHKLVFLNIGEDEVEFEAFVDEFCEDIYSLSDKHGYIDQINRPRKWKKYIVETFSNPKPEDVIDYINKAEAEVDWKRKANLILTLLIGCINDLDKIGKEDPKTLLDKVKHNIVLFDGDQTRFIYKEYNKKVVSVQGLSGTGKTELLLHRLKNAYTNEPDSTIFFTCHNRVLARTLANRVTAFFNFMNVNKQIEWEKRLWISHAWGSSYNPNSGLYSFLCHFYKVPFIQYQSSKSYEVIFTRMLEALENIPSEEFEPALDYIFIDERQDFPDVFIKVCEKVTRKMVCWAGDIYQDIFETRKDSEVQVDLILNRCYRTDPRTLMFAHSIAMGLFDRDKLDWQDKQGWNSLGYEVEMVDNLTREVHLKRQPIDRFQEVQETKTPSVVIIENTATQSVIELINRIKQKHTTINAHDLCIIVIGTGNYIYEYMDKLTPCINQYCGWKVNRAVESKEKVLDHVYLTNTNNVKGLEFPFVICVCDKIEDDYRSRNTYYTMLTRSFLQTFLLLNKTDNIPQLKEGLDIINDKGYIKTSEPSQAELEKIRQNKIVYNETSQMSLDQFLANIFDEIKVPETIRTNLKMALLNVPFNKFDKELVVQFIDANLKFYK